MGSLPDLQVELIKGKRFNPVSEGRLTRQIGDPLWEKPPVRLSHGYFIAIGVLLAVVGVVKLGTKDPDTSAPRPQEIPDPVSQSPPQ